MPTVNSSKPESEPRVVFVKEFRHWRSGKIIRAEDYGYKAFPIAGNGKKK